MIVVRVVGGGVLKVVAIVGVRRSRSERRSRRSTIGEVRRSSSSAHIPISIVKALNVFLPILTWQPWPTTAGGSAMLERGITLTLSSSGQYTSA